MSSKSRQLEAFYLRRREIEHMRVERTKEVSRYYNHWDKVNSRYNNWTTPEYYEKAEARLVKKKEMLEKAKSLEERREKLKSLFEEEHLMYEKELRNKRRPKSRREKAKLELLEKVNQHQKEQDAIRRKLELEAKLYGKWRHGVDDPKLLFDSKSDNQVLAKLNWLDKKIEDQMQREKDKALEEERNIRMQEEVRRTEQIQKERQLIREQEIKDIRALQEKHMDELKQRQSESEILKCEEKKLRAFFEELSKELELLNESSALSLESADATHLAHNIKKIKIFIRRRADSFIQQVKLAVDMLERIKSYATKPAVVEQLLSKYRKQLECEKLSLPQLDAMYESEAKHKLKICEETWREQLLDRYQELQQLIKDERDILTTAITENLQRQNDIIDVRSTHLSSIESSNDKLRQLMKESKDSPRSAMLSANEISCSSATLPNTTSNMTPQITLPTESPSQPSLSKTINSSQICSRSSLPKVTDSFSNLNLDVWENMPASAPGGIDSPHLQSQRSWQVVTPQNAIRPKFARKRIAWT